MESELLTGALFVSTAVVGATELLTRLFRNDFEAAAKIATAATVGAVCGLAGVFGLDVVHGVFLGLSASGFVTVAGKVKA